MESKIIDKVAWIYLRDKKILSTRSKGKDTYYIPGGKREGNESDSECLIREIKEELSVNVIPNTIKYMETFEAVAHGQLKETIVRMTCYYADFNGDLKPASEIDEYVWFEHKDKVKSSPVDNIIFDWLKAKDMLD